MSSGSVAQVVGKLPAAEGGSSLPRRAWPGTQSRWRIAPWLRAAALTLCLALVTAAARLPFAGAYLANWDSVQYALGLTDFDVVRHQPHPPGSILYEALGRLALALTGDANQALCRISALASAAAVPLCYWVGRQMFGRRTGFVATTLYFASPLCWYYGTVALPYSLEGALALAVVGLCWQAAEERRPRAALAAAAVLAVAGGVRQTTMLLLLPLWLYAAWRSAQPAGGTSGKPPWPSIRSYGAPVRVCLSGLALMGVLCLAWAIPLLALSGGLGRYMMASRQLSSLVSGLTSVFVHGLPAAAANATYVWDVVAAGLNLALVPFAVFLLPGVRWPWAPATAQQWFFMLWVAPPLAVFTALHIGQAGYLLVVWPLICCAAATAALVAAEVADRRLRLAPERAAVLVAVLLGGTGAALFLFAPLFSPRPQGLSFSETRATDRFWRGATALAHTLGPEQTAILTGSASSESFRHATYYLPRFHVYAVGLDRDGRLGAVFEGYERRHTYAQFMAGSAAAARLTLPPGTRRFLILDESTAGVFPKGALEKVEVTPTRAVWLWPAAGAGQDVDAITFPRYATVDLAR